METKKRTYTAEFKRDALELAKQLGNVNEAARRLGVCDSLIHNWRKAAEGAQPAPQANGNAPGALMPAEAQELARLRKENHELKKVNEILKQAAAFFSQDHLK